MDKMKKDLTENHFIYSHNNENTFTSETTDRYKYLGNTNKRISTEKVNKLKYGCFE